MADGIIPLKTPIFDGANRCVTSVPLKPRSNAGFGPRPKHFALATKLRNFKTGTHRPLLHRQRGDRDDRQQRGCREDILKFSAPPSTSHLEPSIIHDSCEHDSYTYPTRKHLFTSSLYESPTRCPPVSTGFPLTGNLCWYSKDRLAIPPTFFGTARLTLAIYRVFVDLAEICQNPRATGTNVGRVFCRIC